MIFQKDIGGVYHYTLQSDTPPTSIAYTVVDDRDTTRATGTIATMPVAYSVATTTVQGDGLDVRLDLDLEDGDTVDAGIRPGETALRVTDSEGRIHDLVCSGRGPAHLLVSGITLGPEEECVTVWVPGVAIPVSGSVCDECADGYRVHVTVTDDDGTHRDVRYFAVAPYTLEVPLTVRTFLDWHPEFGAHQSALIRRRDWARLRLAAIALLEAKLKASGNWLQLVATPHGLQRAAAEALYYIVGAEYVPSEWAGALGDFERSRERRLSNAVEDLLANAKVDRDADGKLACTTPEAKDPSWRIRL